MLEDLEELWASIMRSIDELVHVIKPKQMLFLAVDGVAPRAKMNQQRARRFKSAKEREMLTNQLRAQGKTVHEMFDTNAISPGTEFMVNLCHQLHFFLKYKLNTDPLYQNLKECIISDGHVPGEGEHKMLDYIRAARAKPNYDPNTRHCFYGADADLIMLSLLTHEPHFTIIREEHIVKKQTHGGVQRVELSKTNQFQLIHISLLREYFQLEYRDLVGKLRMPWNLERIIDDFVFFCFFIGNDFLPSISALDIAEGSLDKLIELYKIILPSLDDYITLEGVINWERAEKLIWVMGEHEDEVYKERLESNGSRREEYKVVSVTQDVNPLMAEGKERGNRSLQTYNLFKDKIFQKKVSKVAKLKAKGDGKKYKKFLITKMFREEAEGQVKIPKEAKDNLVAKFRAMYKETTKDEETKDQQDILEVVKQIDEGCFSDLNPEEIPDDCVSDVDEGNQNLESIEESAQQTQQDNLTNAAAEMVKSAEEANLRFMKDFIKLYAQDSNAAKALYYNQKVNIDISTPIGVEQRKRMMKKYIEGIQWVLFYYYRGAPHWRWYYPYHYAPLIGDFGINLVKEFLGGLPKISSFEIDVNCPEEKEPYTPFQQLLAIMPIRSFKLLPECYRHIATNELKSFFPDEFSVDLNGKTLAWEAIVLIPFVDQTLFLEMEQKMLDSGAHFTHKETARNKWNFCYHNYLYEPTDQHKQLHSTLTNFNSLQQDHTQCHVINEYENVGEGSFTPKLLPGCINPSVGYPSFQPLGVIDITYETILVRKVQFKKILIKIPQCKEESQPEFLEEYLWKLAKQHNKHIFVDCPFQKEAWPICFEDEFCVYTLDGDLNTNQFTIRQNQQTKSHNEWEGHMKRVRHRLTERGIDCPADTTNVLVTCSRVNNVLFNGEYDNHYFYKTYDEKYDILPLSLVLRRRDNSHYLNVDGRCVSLEHDVTKGQSLIFLKNNLFGVMGRVDAVDMRKQLVKIAIDKGKEEAKVHDPFMGEKHLKHLQSTKAHDVEKSKAFFGEVDVDHMLNLRGGTTARITSSFMLTYKDPKTKEKHMVDIGLNMKSWTKQMHVPGFIRFTQTGDSAAVNQFDEFQHNQFARGSKHVRAHWEYSLTTVEIIKSYAEAFPEVFQCVGKSLKVNSRIPQLKDLFGSNEPSHVDRLKQILKWIDQLEVSHLPFVDIGFDALTPEMIKSMVAHREAIQKECQPCNLIAKPTEWAKTSQVFVEKFPFWASPFPPAEIQKYHVGDRVININSTLRNYVPFGLRGTIIGKTSNKVMVSFDEQFLQGSDIDGHCSQYTGAILDPNHLINITKKFRKFQHDNNYEIIEKFTEVHLSAGQQREVTQHQDPQLVNHTQNEVKPKEAVKEHQPQQETKHRQVTQQPEQLQEHKQAKPDKKSKQTVQKQASTGYVQASYYKAKAYQPVQQKQAPIEPVYQPRQKLEAEPKSNPEASVAAEKQATKIFDDPAIAAFQPKAAIFEDPAIASIQGGETGLPKLMFAPINTELKVSPEFERLLADMNNQPQTIQGMMNVLEQLTAPSDSSSTSQAMMDPTSKPFVPSEPPSEEKKE